jgi:hypothetical protein
MATSSEMKPRLSKMQPCSTSSSSNFTTRVRTLDGWKNLPGHGQEISLQDKSTACKEGFELGGDITSSPFGTCQPNTLASKANATFDMQHQLDGNVAQGRETQKGSSCTGELGAEDTTETVFTPRYLGDERAGNEDLGGSFSSYLPSPDAAVKEFAKTWSSFLADAPTGAKVINERTSSKQRNVREGGLGKKSFDAIPSVETNSSFYDHVAPFFEEFEKETKIDLFEDIRTSLVTSDTKEEKKEPRGKPDMLADSSVVYHPPHTAGTRNVTSAPEKYGFLTWPFDYSWWNCAPNPRPSRKIDRKLGAAQRLGLLDDDDDDLASDGSIMGESNPSSFNSSREPYFHGSMKTETHSGFGFSEASSGLHDSRRGYEYTTHDSFSQESQDSTYASYDDLEGDQSGTSEWEVVSVFDLPSLYNDETGTVNSQALQDFLDAAGNDASVDSISDGGGDMSVSEDSVGQVDDAIAKFKLHASRLGVDEKDLLLAIQNGVVE